MMNSCNFIEIIPNCILLKKTTNDYYESSITLNNLIEQNVLFKVFNNKKTTYSSTPNYGFISPRGSIVIDIKRLERTLDQDNKTSDKFLIIAFSVDYPITDQTQAKNIINKEDLTQNDKQKFYINVVLDNIENNNSSTLNVSDSLGNDLSSHKSLDELKWGLDNLRKKIEEEKINNDKLNNIINNLNKNKEMTRKKIDVTSFSSKTESANLDSYSLNIVLLVCILSYILGAYIAKISNYK